MHLAPSMLGFIKIRTRLVLNKNCSVLSLLGGLKGNVVNG